MSEINVLVAWLTSTVRHRHAQKRHEEDGNIISDVILWSIVAAGTIAIATLVISKFTGKAESIPTE